MKPIYPILALLLIYFSVASMYAIRTPAWQSPDEPAHYNYIAQLAKGQLPMMEAEDYDQAYQNEVVSAEFPPELSTQKAFHYEDYQPPLYYLLETPTFIATDGNLTALRLTSVLMGAGVIFLTYQICLTIFQKRWELAILPTMLVALLPQHLHILSSVNNDALAELLVAGVLYCLVQPKWTSKHLVGMGVLLGGAFLTKVTACLVLIPILVAIFWRYRANRHLLIRSAVTIFLPALLLGGCWWVRNIVVYPGFDFLGTVRHDEVVVGQLTTADYIAQFGNDAYWERYRTFTFQSFWGFFGWMAQPMKGLYYTLLAWGSGVAMLGALLSIRNIGRWTAEQWERILLLGSLLAINIALYVTYNLSYVQHQGRYLFVSLIPIMVLASIGVNNIVPKKIRPIVFLLIFLGLMALNGYVILQPIYSLNHFN